MSNNIESLITKTYSLKIWRRFIKGIEKYNLINDGDRIAVCISGGKDSMLLAKMLQMVEKYKIYDIQVKYIMMDAGYDEEQLEIIKRNAELFDIPLEIFSNNIFEDTMKIDGSPCFFCSRMRRGNLYRKAKEYNCNKIALGHHYNDVIETTLMSMLYGAQIQTMLPKVKSDNVEGMELIRPMYLIHEEDILSWVQNNNLTFVKCACRLKTTDGNEATSRLRVKKLIKELQAENNTVESNIFGSIENINLRKILGYQMDGEHRTFLDNY